MYVPTKYMDMKKSSVDHHEGLEDHGIYFWSFVCCSNFIRRSVTDRKLIFSIKSILYSCNFQSSNFEFIPIFFAFDVLKKKFPISPQHNRRNLSLLRLTQNTCKNILPLIMLTICQLRLITYLPFNFMQFLSKEFYI